MRLGHEFLKVDPAFRRERHRLEEEIEQQGLAAADPAIEVKTLRRHAALEGIEQIAETPFGILREPVSEQLQLLGGKLLRGVGGELALEHHGAIALERTILHRAVPSLPPQARLGAVERPPDRLCSKQSNGAKPRGGLMAEPQPADKPQFDEDRIEESIEVNGVPLVVWTARLSLFFLIQSAIVLGSYAYYGFGTDPGRFGPGFGLDPIHASVNLVWGLAGSVIGFFMPRLSIAFVLAFAVFYTLFAGFGTFTSDHFGMRLDAYDNVGNWLMALAAWGIGIYALSQASLRANPPAA